VLGDMKCVNIILFYFINYVAKRL